MLPRRLRQLLYGAGEYDTANGVEEDEMSSLRPHHLTNSLILQSIPRIGTRATFHGEDLRQTQTPLD